jgi:Acetyl xylan esterase (AXE1)
LIGMKVIVFTASLVVCATIALADEPARRPPPDARLTTKPRDLDGHFPFQPPTDLGAWFARRDELKTQLLVSQGLWPMPERRPLQPVMHGRIDRGDYTVEKVYFASLPGHYVSGNLYRPKVDSNERHAAMLCPHGHWANGRMFDAGVKAAQKEIDSGGETWIESARYILQAKCAQLARMGCVVFHYDMLGYADSMAIPHRAGFTDPLALLNLQSQMGLQTWNSIRALDFVCGLPDVDPSRIGVTGGSGGGTQSFMLAALDDRITAAFPAVMVSTAMQGGCICENAPYLRVGTGNIEIAALCAPRPLGMTGAKDWTVDIESKGLPELRALYRLYGCEEHVVAWCFPQFGHNYNQVSREMMYNWFNKHLRLRQPVPVRERAFVPIPPKELSVFDAEHPRPSDEVGADGVKRVMTEQAKEQLRALEPANAAQFTRFRRVVGPALTAMIHDRLPEPDAVEVREAGPLEERNGLKAHRYWLSRKGLSESIPAYGVGGEDFDGTVVVWVHPAGIASLFKNGEPAPAVRVLLERKAAVLAVDVIGTGDLAAAKPAVNVQYAGYTLGYNPPFVAQRVHDILTAIAFAQSHPKTKRVHLVGWDSAGPWVVIAKALAGDAVSRCVADLNGFRFDSVRSIDDPMMLPGALKYGGLGAFAALAAPGDLLLHNHRGTGTGQLLPQAYKAANAEQHLCREPERLRAESVIEWLMTNP